MATARKKKTRRTEADRAAAAPEPASGTGPDERPPAPWGSFPLVELAVLAGLVLIAVGAISGNPTQLALGLLLGSVGGLELSIREHFSGYRSHTTLLAAVVFVLSTGVAFFLVGLVLWICLGIGATIAGLAFWRFREAFRQASGGLSYRLR